MPESEMERVDRRRGISSDSRASSRIAWRRTIDDSGDESMDEAAERRRDWREARVDELTGVAIVKKIGSSS